MRLTTFIAAVTLLLCLSLAGNAPTSNDLISSRSSASSSTSSWFVNADASAFDDEDDVPQLPIVDDDDAPAVSATVPTPSEPTPVAPIKPVAQKKSSIIDDDDDIDELLADSDEFEGATPVITKQKEKTKTKGKKKSSKKKKQKSPLDADFDPNDPSIQNVMAAPTNFFQPIGIFEYFGFTLIVVYIVMYFLGKSQNTKLARQFTEKFSSIFEEQFSVLGDTPPVSGESKAFQFVQESPNSFRLFSSGRKNCSGGMLLTLSLIPRQDLFSRLLSIADLATSRDTITLEFALGEDELDAFLFGVVKKQGTNATRKFVNEYDANSLTTQIKAPRAGLDKYAIVTEFAELDTELLNERCVKLLSKPEVESLFLSLLVTDQTGVAFSATKKSVRFQFALPSVQQFGDATTVEALASLLRFSFYFFDVVTEYRLTNALRVRSEAHRKKLLETQAKQTVRDRMEEQARKKELQRQKEKEIIERDPNSDQAKQLIRKREAKQAKLEKKAKGSNIKVMR